MREPANDSFQPAHFAPGKILPTLVLHYAAHKPVVHGKKKVEKWGKSESDSTNKIHWDGVSLESTIRYCTTRSASVCFYKDVFSSTSRTFFFNNNSLST